MVKPVGSLCNLRCSYCYYGARHHSAAGRQIMADELLELFVRQYIEASTGPVVSFTWHGGEPTLAGLDFFRLAVDLQKKYLPKGWSCWNNLQTNGTLLNDEWCKFLAEENFDIGLSIDGPQWNHDLYRKDSGGHCTWQSAADAAARLKSRGIRPDLLCTVTAESAKDPLAVYRALRGMDTGWVQFIPIVRRNAEGRVTPDSVSGAAYGKFLCAVFDEWALHDMGRLDVQLFAETMRVWAGGESGLCLMAPVCGRALIVEKDGGVYSCDHFVNPDHRIGDILSSPLGVLAGSPAQIRFGNDKRSRLCAKCRACRWLAVCGGGCPKDRFAFTDDGEPGLNYLCEGLELFFSYINPAAKIIQNLKIKGLPAEEIPGALRKMFHAKWEGVGRNDPCPCGSGLKAKNCCWNKRV